MLVFLVISFQEKKISMVLNPNSFKSMVAFFMFWKISCEFGFLLKVLPMLVERKTWDDLWSSTKTRRFLSQVQRMKVNRA